MKIPKIASAGAVIVIVAWLTGCAASGPKFAGLEPVPANTGHVYFYRLHNFVGSAIAYEILVNGEKRAALQNAGFLKIDLAPGKYALTAQPSISNALSISGPVHETVAVEPGQRYFFRLHIGSRLGASTNPLLSSQTLYVNPNALVPLPEEVAVKQMSGLGYSD